MTEFTKFAVTVPTETYTVVEQLRLQLGKSRSAVVAAALDAWVRSARRAEADRRYIEGYLRVPESPAALDALGAVAAQATSHWDTWAPGEPLRAEDNAWRRPPPRGPAAPRPALRAKAPARRPRAAASKRPRR